MPIVRIDYEKDRVSDELVSKIAEKIQVLSAEVTGYELKDISVFASKNQITVNAAPIEVYIYATFNNLTESDMKAMLEKLSPLVKGFKKENNIDIPFNLSVVKMNWHFNLEV